MYAILIQPALIDLTNLLSEAAHPAANAACSASAQLTAHSHRAAVRIFYNCPLTGRQTTGVKHIHTACQTLQQAQKVFPADSNNPQKEMTRRRGPASVQRQRLRTAHWGSHCNYLQLSLQTTTAAKERTRRRSEEEGYSVFYLFPGAHFCLKWHKEGFKFHRAMI